MKTPNYPALDTLDCWIGGRQYDARENLKTAPLVDVDRCARELVELNAAARVLKRYRDGLAKGYREIKAWERKQ